MTDFKTIDFGTLKRSDRYYLMTSTIVPRPIAIVGTINEKGEDNLAPFSYFNAVSSDPPCIMFSIGQKRGPDKDHVYKKDTLINIELTNEFVIHIANSALIQTVDDLSEELPYGVSERAKLGLRLTASTWIKTPRVVEFPIAYECRLEKLVELGTNTVVFGRILGGHVRSDLLVQGQDRVSPFLLDPLARLDQDYAGILPLPPELVRKP